jgi:hypothetical protein
MVAELTSSPQSSITLADDTGTAREIYCLAIDRSTVAALRGNI